MKAISLVLIVMMSGYLMVSCNPLGEPEDAPREFGLGDTFYSWDFLDSSNYNFNTNYVEISSGRASLKTLDQNFTGTDFNTGTYQGTTLTSSLLTIDSTTATDLALSSTWTPEFSSLVGYWQMEGNWNDSTTNGFNASPSVDVSFSTDAKVGTQASSFDGDLANLPYAELPSNATLDNLQESSYTISAWFKPRSVPPNNSTDDRNYTILRKNGFNFGLAYRFNQRFVFNHYNSSNVDVVVNSNRTYPVGFYYFVVGVTDFDTNTINLYVNGEPVGNIAFDGTTREYNSNLWRIGVANTAVSFRNPADGEIDELALWSKALSAGDVATIYHRQKQKYAGHYDSSIIDVGSSQSWTYLNSITTLPFFKEIVAQASESSSQYSLLTSDLRSDLVSYFGFNDSLNDGTTNSNNTTSGGTISYSSGLFNNAITFDGTVNSYLNHPLSTLSSGSGAVSFWVSTVDDEGFLIYGSDTNTGDGTGAENELHIDITTGTPRLFIEGGGSDVSLTAAKRIDDSLWHHIAASWESSGAATLYVDGESAGTTTHGANNFSFSTTFRIGQAATGAATRFAGSIDELSFWSQPISLAQVREVYRRGANRIKYQVKSCADASCVCKEFKRGSTDSNDCDGDGTPNTTDPDNEDTLSEFSGPGGSGATSFSEIFNRLSGNMTFNCAANTTDTNGLVCVNNEITFTGDSRVTAPSFVFSDIATSAVPASNRYFQYRVIMEAEDNTACSGQTCFPELSSIEVGPNSRYYGGSPVVSSTQPISFSEINQIRFTTGGSCSLTYQLSLDGTTYYYHNGTAWVSATGENVSESASGSTLNTNIKTFKDDVGSGNLYFKAFLTSDTTQACTLDKVEIGIPD